MVIKKINAFSLAELSIVLIIIGLLVAGVSAGSKLVRSAKLSSFISEVSEMKIIVRNFKYQYGGWPGDITNAYSFWGSASCTNATVNSTRLGASNGDIECNGNGDGLIKIASGEMYKAWQHLSLSGYVSGTYTGNVPASGNHCVIGETCPSIHAFGSPSVFSINSNYVYTYGASNGDQTDMHLLAANKDGFAGKYPSASLLSAREIYKIDKKIDDGQPATGIVESIRGEDPSAVLGCILNGSSAQSTEYNLPDNGTYTYDIASSTSDTAKCVAAFFLDRL